MRFLALAALSASLLLSCVASAGCNAAQRRAFAEAFRSQEFQHFLDRSTAWLVAEFGNQKESTIALRDPPEYGHIVGRWFVPALEVADLQDGTLQITFKGSGYVGHPRASNVMFSAVGTAIYKPELNYEGDYVYIAFHPLSQPGVTFTTHRITAMAEWGNTIENRQQAAEEGAKAFAAKLGEGFTVAMNRKLEQETWLGLGLRKRLPAKPYYSMPGEHEVINEFVDIREDGRDFVGPIHLKQGDVMRVRIRTEAHWGMDCFLSEDQLARAELASHIDRDRYPDADRASLRSATGTKRWEEDLTALADIVVWLIIDNTNGGVAAPPTNGVDDVVSATVFVSVLRSDG